MARVLLLPSAIDCDPTEVAIPWSVLSGAGHQVSIATSTGAPPTADPRMLSGRGLSILSPVLRARADARTTWDALRASPAYRETARAAEVNLSRFEALLLPGGHAPGMRTYLECLDVQRLAVRAFDDRKMVIGAICHGVVVLARARTDDGKSVLHGHRTTSLTRAQEMLAWKLTRAWLGDYYRTYPTTVEDEVTAALESPDHFEAGPNAILRDDPEHLDRGFIVEDGRYVSARWPGDAYAFSAAIARRLP